jgi:mannosyltransferase OCH1-like enzyme
MKLSSYLLCVFVLASKIVYSYEYAKYDVTCDSMLVQRCDAFHDSYSKEIPRKIHQIWFGDKAKIPNQTNDWKDYANEYDYEYFFWNEKKIEDIKVLIHPSNWELIQFFINTKNYWSASDIVRCELLRIFGGIYVDCDFYPPNQNGRFLSLETFVVLRGSFFLTENHCPSIGEGALFVCNGFMGSCQGHPIMGSICHQFSGNIKKFHKMQNCYDSRYITGPFILNKVLNGSFQVIPIKFSVDLNMWP